MREQLLVRETILIMHSMTRKNTVNPCGFVFPAYPITIPLDKAIRLEPKAAELLTATEYNRLALLGSFLGISKRPSDMPSKHLTRARVLWTVFRASIGSYPFQAFQD